MKIFRCSRRSVTLLEVLIAMALTVIILTTLTFFYKHVGMLGVEIDKSKNEGFYVRYLESRLADTLPKVVVPTDPDFAFFSTSDEGLTKPGSQSLIFTFNNGASLDKKLANNSVARLYLNKEGNLMLAYWPTPRHLEQGLIPPMKQELLFEKVESLAFEFFVAPEKSQRWSPKGTQEPESKGDWRSQPWLRDFQNVPLMVKVIVSLPENAQNTPEGFLAKIEGKKVITFILPIMNKKTPHVVYD